MECPRCGTIYDSNFCPNCAYPANPVKHKKSVIKRWWFWFLLFIATIVVILSFVESVKFFSNEFRSIFADDVNTTQPTQSAVPKDGKYYVGDTFNAAGLEITYESAETWTDYSEYSKPEEGYKYIRIKISAKNTTSTDKSIYSFYFTCYADDKKQTSYYGTDELEGGTIAPGRKDDGYLYFIVPITAEYIEVEYESYQWRNQRAILVVGRPG